MTHATVIREMVDRIERDRPVAAVTVIEGAEGLGSKILVGPDGILAGTLGADSLDSAASAFAMESLRTRTAGTTAIDDRRLFVEIHLPPPRLVIVGAVHIASTLSRLARELGFRVVVSDARDRFATPERFPDVDELILGWPNEILPGLQLDAFSHVVVVTHDAKLDNPALIAALRSPAPYVGALGSKKTHARRVRTLREAGVTESDIERIHAPIGLDIGASSPQEIALATMAEIVAVRNRAGEGRS